MRLSTCFDLYDTEILKREIETKTQLLQFS